VAALHRLVEAHPEEVNVSNRSTRRTTGRQTGTVGGIGAVIIVLIFIVLRFFFGGADSAEEAPPAGAPSTPTEVSEADAAPIVADPATPTAANEDAAEPATDAPPAADDAVRVYFTTPSLIYPDRRDNRPAVPLLEDVIADIDAATARVDVAVFDLDLPTLAEALRRAAERGVAVGVVLDNEHLESPEVAEVVGILEQGQVTVVADDREAFMHSKFLVVDGTIVWTGSWNMTANDTFRNNNNMLRLVSPALAAAYTTEFETMYAGNFGPRKAQHGPTETITVGSAAVQVFFSPRDRPSDTIVAAIAAARESIRFMTFSFTADPIADAMIAQQQAGIPVRGVFEKTNSRGTGAEYDKLVDAGIDVVRDGNCYILHHKVIIIDDRLVLTGSYNFTGSAETSNDENLVFIEDPAVVAAYVAEFDRLYDLGVNPLVCGQ
jgi:phosphatidylserine/phosphatidylglycerophosphate/cardiolipin synthase-like enzyme